MTKPARSALLTVLLLLLASGPLWGQATTQSMERKLKRAGLATEALAGQVVGVLPLTHMSRDTALRESLLLGPRTAVLHWADSVMGEVLLAQAPEVSWMLPPELRKAARKGVGMIPEPDRMGQSIMRSPKLDQVPDPLRQYLRTLMGIAGGRFVFIPASIAAGRDEEGAVKLTLTAVVADTRNGKVVWRSLNAIGTGASAGPALEAAMQSFLPNLDKP
jgi:hypothetical protein